MNYHPDTGQINMQGCIVLTHSAVLYVGRNLWICAIHGSRCAIYGSILCAGIHGSCRNLCIELHDPLILHMIQYSWRRHIIWTDW